MMRTTNLEARQAIGDDAYHRRVAQALDAALGRTVEAEKGRPREVDAASARYVIFSDHHKGTRDRADDFRRNERAYNAALAYYFAEGYTLVELGDVEELWKDRAGRVIEKYKRSLELSAQFERANRYLRFWGNHDDAWSFEGRVRRHLHPVYGPQLRVHEALRLRITDGGRELGHLFFLHGHQGTGASDRFSGFSRLVVRFVWRPLQRLFNFSLNTPATSWVLRERHNIALHGWAARQGRLVLVAGHTHRPVFLSRTRAEQVVEELAAAWKRLEEEPENTDLRRTVAELSAELEWVRGQDEDEKGPEGEAGGVKRPCYFNTGCCCYLDGDITGLEIADGELRLVRWPDDKKNPKPQVLARMPLAAVFDALDTSPAAAQPALAGV